MSTKKLSPRVKQTLKPVKTGIDFFWYFLFSVVAVIYILERNVISFDNNEWQMVKELVPALGGLFSFAAYRSYSKAKEVAEVQQEEMDEKQSELDETKDELAESRQANKG